MMAHAPRAPHVTPATLETDVSVSSWNDLVRARNTVAKMSLADLSGTDLPSDVEEDEPAVDEADGHAPSAAGHAAG